MPQIIKDPLIKSGLNSLLIKGFLFKA